MSDINLARDMLVIIAESIEAREPNAARGIKKVVQDLMFRAPRRPSEPELPFGPEV